MPSAFVSLGCRYPPAKTGTGGAPASPSRSTSIPCRIPHQRRAQASATTLAIVAPVVRTPPHAAGSPNNSRSQASDSVSSRVPSGEDTQVLFIWSIAEAIQSAPSAAGVVPPVTKWKNRGPVERTAPPRIASSSSATAALAPEPSSGRDPPNEAATPSAPGGRTGSSSIPRRKAAASRATASTTCSASSRRGDAMRRNVQNPPRAANPSPGSDRWSCEGGRSGIPPSGCVFYTRSVLGPISIVTESHDVYRRPIAGTRGASDGWVEQGGSRGPEACADRRRPGPRARGDAAPRGRRRRPHDDPRGRHGGRDVRPRRDVEARRGVPPRGRRVGGGLQAVQRDRGAGAARPEERRRRGEHARRDGDRQGGPARPR